MNVKSISYVSILKNRNFALLWGGQAVSQLGDMVFYIALMWLVVDLTGSALAVGTVLIFTQVPRLLLQIFGGVVVDRYDRRTIMLSADLLRGVVVLAFSWLVLSQRVEIWHVYVLAVIFGLVGAFFFPAQTAVVPSLVRKEELITANSLTSMTLQANNIAGPAIGGLLISLPAVGVGGACLVNGVSFLAGALGILLITIPRTASEGVKEPFFKALGDGFTYMKANRVILVMAAFASFLNFAAIPIFVLMPLFAREILHTTAQGFGFMESSIGGGLLLGSIAIGMVGKVRRRGPAVLTLLVAQGLVFAVFALSKTLLIAMGMLLACGVFNGIVNVLLMALLQEMVVDEYRGRVFSLLMVLSGGLQPVSMGIAGGAADAFGVIPVLVVCGLGVAVISLIGFLLKDVRTID